VLQCVAVCCSVLQCVAVCCIIRLYHLHVATFQCHAASCGDRWAEPFPALFASLPLSILARSDVCICAYIYNSCMCGGTFPALFALLLSILACSDARVYLNVRYVQKDQKIHVVCLHVHSLQKTQINIWKYLHLHLFQFLRILIQKSPKSNWRKLRI